jgi:hypothetical protein
MNIFEEIPWFQFKLIDTIKKLPLQEQVIKYNVYMADLHHRRAVWHILMHEGKSSRKEIQITGVLLQEDLFDLLQEDGSQIYITSEVNI